MDGPQDVTMLVLDAPPSPDNDPSSWIVAADALADAAEATGRRAVDRGHDGRVPQRARCALTSSAEA